MAESSIKLSDLLKSSEQMEKEYHNGPEKRYWYGNPEIEYISHGEWNDPELIYKGLSFNYWEIEDALAVDFSDEYPDINLDKPVNIIDGREGAETIDTEAAFAAYVQDHACDYLDTVIDADLGCEYGAFGKELTRDEVRQAWAEFTDGCVDENDCIDTAFYRYPIGTFREDIWHDFEDIYKVAIGESINSGKLCFHDTEYVSVDLEELYNRFAPDNTKCGEFKLSFGSIEATEESANDFKPYYFDFFDERGNIICMTGETCEVVDVEPNYVLLRNYDGFKPLDMKLSLEEFEIACSDYKNPDDIGLNAECKDMSQAKENVNETHEDMGKEKEGR